jgi:hypothetical protein
VAGARVVHKEKELLMKSPCAFKKHQKKRI